MSWSVPWILFDRVTLRVWFTGTVCIDTVATSRTASHLQASTVSEEEYGQQPG